MIVRVIRASTPNCWYSGCIGDTFYGFVGQDQSIVFFNGRFFFYAQDVEIVKSNEGFVPSLELGVA